MDLVDLADSLRRAVAPPGEFDTYFPNTQDADLVGTLMDGIAECQMDGFLHDHELDIDAEQIDPDLTPAQQALVVLYARARVLMARLANIKSRTRYKAGPVEAEAEQAASVLAALLKDTSDRKKQILDDAKYGNNPLGNGASGNFTMVDLFVSKSLDYSTPDLSYLVDFGKN